MSSWPSTIALADAQIVRKMRKRQATAWLEARYPDAPKDDILAALDVCAPDEDTPVAHVIHASPQLRSEFMCAAFLLGATITQLSLVLQLSRGTIHQAIRKRITQNDVREHRRDHRLRFEAVQILWQSFQATLRGTPTAFDGMSIFQVTDFLEASVVYEEDL